jgi:biotin synthase-like enzyme
LGLQTQRGCVFNCVYCTYPTIEGHSVRTRPADEVAREAVALQAAGARYLFLTDSVFNANPAHCLAIAAAFRNAGLTIPWGAYFAPLAPPDHFYERMAEGGCTHVEFGTESLSESMLLRIRKAFRRADALAAHRAARAAGLHVAHFLILGGPEEDEATLEATFQAADLLRDAVIFFFCGMRIFRGTELARIAVESGQVKAGASLLSPTFYQPPHLALSVIQSRLQERAAGRSNWILGSGEERTQRTTSALYGLGHTGPLWEHLVSA